MNFAQAYAAIKAQIASAWTTAGHSTIPLLYPNEPRPTFDENGTQLHIEIRPGAARIAAFGGRADNRLRQSGEVIFRLFTPATEGEDASVALVDDIAALLRNFTSSDLRFDAGPPPAIGSGAASDENGAFYQRDVIAPFIYDFIG